MRSNPRSSDGARCTTYESTLIIAVHQPRNEQANVVSIIQ
jgi:hypothetical protein